jgi:hypothetical protein
MPTLDVRGKDVREYANDASLTVQGLTVNFSSLYPLTEVQARKLATSFELARRAVDAASHALAEIALGADAPSRRVGAQGGAGATGAAPIPPAAADALVRHLKFGALPSVPGKSHEAAADWPTWKADIVKVYQSLRALRAGLAGNVTISDSKSRAIRAFVEEARPNKPYMQGLTNAEAIAKVTAVGNPAATAQLDGQVQRHKVEQNLAGYVRVRTAEKARMQEAGTWDAWGAKDPFVRVAPENKASIHIDFDYLTAHPRLFVAYMILHEATHKFCHTRDFAYAGQAAYATMDKASALMNADSFAFLTVSLYKMHPFEDRDHIMSATGRGVDLES